ncbi:MAG: aldehyde dehydrogenase family protein [Myxococcota bacterium]|nr:aldehyde dehydrogenase family protein [Myxococcota bacterium]
MDNEAQLRIRDRWETGARGSYPIVNPATEEEVAPAPEGSREQALEAARAAREAFPAWAATPAEERSRLLQRAAELLRARAEALLPLVIAETGCTETVGRQMQIPVAADRFEAYARYALDSPVLPLPPQEMPATPLASGGVIGALARRQPVGVVACITPYNFPIVSLAGKLGPALAMGNTAVVRPAPQDPLAVVELVRILEAAGFPPGVVNLVTGSTPETGEALVTSPDVDMVSFTGSSAVGARIAEAGGRGMKRLLLELGGKGAALVLDDADVETAVRAIGSVWTFHSGQICTAPTRAIVHRRLYEPVVEGLSRLGRGLPIGPPTDPKTVVGPVISAAQRDRIEAHVRGAREDGAELLIGGERPAQPGRGFYAAPTLLATRPDARVAQEEIFGPVIVAIPFDEEDEGVAITNGTPYGLYDYVFSRDAGRAMAISRRLRAGNVGINTTQRNHATPFGGTKMSGIGRDGGEFGLHAYSELQSVVWPG